MDVSVGTRLRVLRKDVGLTQAQLAALADTNQAAINRYETDRAAAPYRILVCRCIITAQTIVTVVIYQF